MKNPAASAIPVVVLMLTAVTWAPASSAAVLCVSPSGAGPAGDVCHTTIQAAVDRAGPGDLVRILPGVYFENVHVRAGKDGLQLLGSGKTQTIVDPSPFFDRGIVETIGVGFLVESGRVQVKDLTVRNGNIGVALLEPDGTVEGLRLTGADFSGVTSARNAHRARILGNEMNASDGGVSASGVSDLVVRNNVITGSNGESIRIAAGDRSQVVGNRIERARGSGVSLEGNDVIVQSNQVRDVGGFAVRVEGERPRIERNVVAVAFQGVSVSCPRGTTEDPQACAGGTIAQNTVSGTTDHGIDVITYSGGLVVRDNRLLRTGAGIRLDGTGITALGNQASDVGRGLDGHCFEVRGSGNRLLRNTATRCSNAGFYLNGNALRLEQNQAASTFENGFTVDGADGQGGFFTGTALLNNSATGNAAQGIAIVNGARETTVTGNTATGNRTDFCDEGVGTVDSGNTFGTIGACAVLH